MTLRTLTARACALLFLAGCSHPEEDPAMATRNFLRAVSKGDFQSAYQSSAFGFRAMQSQGAFSSTAQELALVGAAMESVDLLGVSGHNAKVKVVMDTARGLQPFIVTLDYEQSAWRVFAVKSPPNPRTGLSENRFAPLGKTMAFSDTSGRQPPDDRKVVRLVGEAMNEFAEAVAARSFNRFYHQVSRAWQSQLSERQLENAFRNFLDQDVNLQGVTQTTAVLDAPPMVSNEGLLLVSGHFPTRPFEVFFVFRFISEDDDWKLFGLDVNLRPAPATPVPAPR